MFIQVQIVLLLFVAMPFTSTYASSPPYGRRPGIGTARDQSSQASREIASPGIGTACDQSSQQQPSSTPPPRRPWTPNPDDSTIVSSAASVVGRLDQPMHQLETIIFDQHNANRPDNTKKVYTPKLVEWKKYCDHVYPNVEIPERYLVHEAATYRFMLYQAMRGKRLRGGSRPRPRRSAVGNGTNDNGKRFREGVEPDLEAPPIEEQDGEEEQAINLDELDLELDPDVPPELQLEETLPVLGGGWRGFNADEYDAIMMHYAAFESGEHVGDPVNPNGYQLFGQYKAALLNLWDSQVQRKQSTLLWTQVWDQKHRTLHELVKTRGKRIAKMQYQEKTSTEATPYQAVGEVDRIEEALWNRGLGRNPRSQMAWLRNRFCFLFTFRGVLRAESLWKAELSDFVLFEMQLERDPHPLEMMLMQIAQGKSLFVVCLLEYLFAQPLLTLASVPNRSSTGKTNSHSQTIFGRAMRNKKVTNCPIGAYGFYLMYRFHLSKEFDCPPDFTSNENWFDMKVLTDGSPTTVNKGIGDQVYGGAMKEVLRGLGIQSKHWAHIGRVLGPKYLELHEAPQDDIRVMGNWDPKTQESTYSAKLPMKMVRMMGGFSEGHGMHYSPRTNVEVPEELCKQIFPWVETSREEVKQYERETNTTKDTAHAFFKGLTMMRRIIIQDAAAMKVQYPERFSGSKLFQLELFRSQQFQVFGPDLLYCSSFAAIVFH